MSTPAVYRFLPWSRRGLIAQLEDSTGAAAGALPFRATVKLDMTLSGANGSASVTAAIAGPGDVIGIDTASIVRLTPRSGASNVEPNYLVAVDFDEADLPWLMTPSAANAVGQLRPWLALVVVEARDGVTLSVPPGASLPQLKIESGAQRELQDLADSWAWAHTQILISEGSGAEAAPKLASDPDRHVSRLVCPRRLRPNARWWACLVPAFDAGVLRGLGQVPPSTELKPAWTDQDSITLPVYFHWAFGTGAEGDFESLAQLLKPFVIGSDDGKPQVGTVEMHIGAAGGPVDLPIDHPQRVVQMDGALRALQQEDGTLDEVPQEFRANLGVLLDEIADPRGTDPNAGAVGPPLYGAWHANRFQVVDAPDGWFTELNLDPRTRVAAGLGTEVARREQEALMTACWQQAGAVIDANALLSRARLSIEASKTLHAKSVAKLSPERTLAFASPLSGRALVASNTVKAAITQTSLPDATIDPAMRRMLAPTQRFVRKAAQRLGIESTQLGARLITRMAAGSATADPTAFVPAGVAPPPGKAPIVRGDQVDLSPIGIPLVKSKAAVAGLLANIAPAANLTVPPPATRLALRADLRQTGLVTSRQVDAIRSLPISSAHLEAGASDPILTLRAAAAAQPNASGFVLGQAADTSSLSFRALDVTGRGTIVVRTPPTEPSVVVARVAPGAPASAIAMRLPANAIRPGEAPVVVRPGAVHGDVLVHRPEPVGGVQPVAVTPTFEGPTVTVPPLVRDALTINRFEQAVGNLPEISALSDAPPAKQIVAYPLLAAASALTARCDPQLAHTARIESMVRFGAKTLGEARADAAGATGLAVSPSFDRVLAYPELSEPASRMLSRYDRTRLLPGVDAIPPNSVTLLETNPRFVAAFLAGLNHELNRELLWRHYPTDQRGTPVRSFWERIDAGADVPPMHQWLPLTRSLSNAAGGESNLVLLVRGELLRRYPNLVVLAIRASAPNTPSSRDEDVKTPIFNGLLEPDIAYFGFDLVDDDIRLGDGWFFALQEQVTEPRFGLDEVADPARTGASPQAWSDVAWTDSNVGAGKPFGAQALRTLATNQHFLPPLDDGAAIATALFQNPIQVLVHGRHLALTEAT